MSRGLPLSVGVPCMTPDGSPEGANGAFDPQECGCYFSCPVLVGTAGTGAFPAEARLE